MHTNTMKERLTVYKISTLAVSPSSHLIPNIPVGDKDVSFDGHIDVFSDNSEKKVNFVGKVPVQVKSTGVQQFSNSNITYIFEMADIANFFKTGGVLLFVGEVNENGEVRLFYKPLLPLEISGILKDFSGQKSRTIRLRPLDETKLYDLCLNFLRMQQQQPLAIIQHKPYTVSDFNSYEISSLGIINQEDLFKEQFALYGIKNNVHIPLSLATLEEIAFDRNVKYEVGDKEYQLFTKIQIQDSNLTLTLEDTFEINIDINKGKFTYGHLEVRTISAQLKLQPFLFDLFSGLEIQFLGQSFELPVFTEVIEEWERHQDFLDDLQSTFSFLNINPNLKLRYDENLLWQLHHLVNLVLHKDYSLVKNFNFGFFTIDLDKYKLVFLKMNGELHNAFSSIVTSLDVEIRCTNGERYKHSPFVKLEESVLATAINLNIEEVQNSFDLFDPFVNETVHIYTDDFCIKCINAYSISGKVELLELANYIYDKSNGTDVEKMESMIVNKLQIKAWKGEELTKEERRLLMGMRRDAIVNGKHTLCACVSILLKDKDEVSMSIDALTSEEQTILKEWPIYKLHLKELGE
ncbi:hypothetical protein [Paenibacillus sp. MER 99-2]|uniref:hypothetical protein n=1 Tax=Paenibacillus sp. MER 99-2 TaxID=2939572 RepID=UPI0020404DBE|nr:hypothetical protein [Paenibacillus sp. MER 99-2]MCM3173236.1 hypothetical protein [Paenibacillus sp. MER 99-2]